MIRALDSLDLDAAASLGRLTDLYKRHGRDITTVMERAMEGGERPAESLLALYTVSEAEAEMAPRTDAVPQPSTVLIEIDEKRSIGRINGAFDVRNTAYQTLATFAELHLSCLGQGMVPEDYRTLGARELLDDWNLRDEANVRRRITTLRSLLTEALGEEGGNVLENIAWQGYRLRPEVVTIRKVDLGTGPKY